MECLSQYRRHLNFAWISFLAFGICLSSTVLKTPIVNLFFWLSFLAIAWSGRFTVFYHGKIMPHDAMMLTLMSYLGVTSIWSGQSLSENLIAIFEYRHLILIPLFTTYFSSNIDLNLRAVIKAYVLITLVPVLASGLIVADLLVVDGAIRSLSNRIFFGFLVSVALACALYLHAVEYGRLKFFWFITAVIFLIGIFVFENGRTGYLQAATVLSIYFYNICRSEDQLVKKVILVSTLCVTGFFLIFLARERLVETLTNLNFFLYEGRLISQSGLRLEMWDSSLQLMSGNWLFGLGIGAVAPTLIEISSQSASVVFDNPHSELINQLLIGGVVGLSNYLVLWLTIFYVIHKKIVSHAEQMMWGSIMAVFFVGSIFNSAFKDFGEKHLFMFLVIIFGIRVHQIVSNYRSMNG